MKTIFSEWQSFERDVVPAAAPAIQREEMRRAFYAGAQAMYALVMVEAVAPDNEDDCEANLEALQQELAAFPTDLREAKP